MKVSDAPFLSFDLATQMQENQRIKLGCYKKEVYLIAYCFGPIPRAVPGDAGCTTRFLR